MDLVGGLEGCHVPAENLKLSPLERIRLDDVEELAGTRGPKSVVLIFRDHVEIPPTD